MKITKEKLKEIIKEEIQSLTRESINERISKIPTESGTLQIDVDEGPGGLFVGIIFNKNHISTTDIQLPSGGVEVTQHKKRIKI